MKKYKDERLGIGLPTGFVPSTAYWVVEKNEWIGMGNIRHCLTGSIERFGGHI